MILQKQRTLKTEISYTGVGLHSGREVHATLKPAPKDTGIVFVRTDLPGAPQIHAKAENVTSTLRATTVEEDGHKVFTIEHLMSAFHAHCIDNAYVELDSEEPPVADGASLVFFELMAKAGIVEQAKDRKEIVIDKVYRIDDEKTGRYICHGSVQIHLGDRLITADEAQITSDLSAIWTQGTARLIDGENIFCSEAIYARPFEGQAYFFGTRCKLKRPGLAIDSDSIEYRWQDKIGVFDGHVLYIDSDGEKAFVHLEYDFNKNKIA